MTTSYAFYIHAIGFRLLKFRHFTFNVRGNKQSSYLARKVSIKYADGKEMSELHYEKAWGL